MSNITFTTLGDLKRGNCKLVANCFGRDCGHGKELDIDKLISRFGENHCLIDEIEITRRLRCEKCGWLGGRLHFSPPSSARR